MAKQSSGSFSTFEIVRCACTASALANMCSCVCVSILLIRSVIFFFYHCITHKFIFKFNCISLIILPFLRWKVSRREEQPRGDSTANVLLIRATNWCQSFSSEILPECFASEFRDIHRIQFIVLLAVVYFEFAKWFWIFVLHDEFDHLI